MTGESIFMEFLCGAFFSNILIKHLLWLFFYRELLTAIVSYNVENCFTSLLLDNA